MWFPSFGSPGLTGPFLPGINAPSSEELLFSAVTIGELQSGIERTRHHDPARAKELETWLSGLPAIYQCLPMDIACFREWARLMDGKPQTLSEDAMSAATARIHGLLVVTRNERDFADLEVRIINPFKN